MKKKNWNKNEWQGRSKQNVDYSTKATAICYISGIVILIIYLLKELL
jgi:hypothetical protein